MWPTLLRVLQLWVLIWGIYALGAISFLPAAIQQPDSARTLGSTEQRKASSVLPFKAADVVRYFSDSLGAAPKVARDGSAVFENPKGANFEDQYRILIVQENDEVIVSFSVAGDYGMNLAREFFECPVFNRRESEQLYALLNEAAKAPIFKMERFSVSGRLWETRDRIHLVLRFFGGGGVAIKNSVGSAGASSSQLQDHR